MHRMQSGGEHEGLRAIRPLRKGLIVHYVYMFEVLAVDVLPALLLTFPWQQMSTHCE